MELNQTNKEQLAKITYNLNAVINGLAMVSNTILTLCEALERCKRDIDAVTMTALERLEKAGWTPFKDDMWVEPNHAFVLQEQQALWFIDRCASGMGELSNAEIYTFIALGMEPLPDGNWRDLQSGKVIISSELRKTMEALAK